MQGSKSKEWAETLRRAANRKSNGESNERWLNIIADRVVRAAADGDMQSVKELGDRLDGKPKQVNEHSGPDGASIPHRVKVIWE